MSKVTELSSLKEAFQELANAGDKLVVVQFYYSFCSACHAVVPALTKLEKDYPEVIFLKAEVEDVKAATCQFGVEEIPTFVAIHRQEELNRYVGNREDNLRKFMEESVQEHKLKVARKASDSSNPSSAKAVGSEIRQHTIQ